MTEYIVLTSGTACGVTSWERHTLDSTGPTTDIRHAAMALCDSAGDDDHCLCVECIALHPDGTWTDATDELLEAVLDCDVGMGKQYSDWRTPTGKLRFSLRVLRLRPRTYQEAAE